MSANLNARRNGIARAWDLRSGAVVVPAGVHVPVAGTDQYHDFHAHPEFTYLAGVQTPGAVLAFDPVDGWLVFAPVANQEDRVWVGDGESLDAIAGRSGARVEPLQRLGGWLEARRSEPLVLLGNHDLVANPTAYGLQSWAALELDVDDQRSVLLSEQVADKRRAKDPAEISLMRSAAGATAPGHRAAIRLARPGMTERQLQIEIEAEFFRAGAERTAYGSIVGSGPNGAILHSSPGQRVFADGDLILVDAGAEFGAYASDVTRTFPVAARFSGIQRDIYEIVLGVQERAIASVKPGVEYKDLHMAAALGIASGLRDLGILRGDPGDLVERDAHALFFVHGLGHMLGLATHDAGGCLAGRQPSDRFGLKWLRADLPLEPDYVVTIEPGIYFIDALLTDPARRDTFRDAVNWGLVDSLRGFGGIRIEDDVLVTEAGADVLSGTIPKSIDEIEAIRREALST
ncbi:MAG: Xaa-Pro aminopeptidase [Anaerolinea sp.]|nr:Xaa-Pro aminopeptidase [Anaerolinea sp.]